MTVTVMNRNGSLAARANNLVSLYSIFQEAQDLFVPSNFMIPENRL